MKSVLSIHSEGYFRRYEEYIAEIINNYPEPTYFQTTRATTLAARLRDSLNAMDLNGWTSELFTLADVKRVFQKFNENGDFIISMVDQNKVYAGPKLKRGEERVVAQKGTRLEIVNEGEIDATRHDVFSAIILLKEEGLIEEPLKMRNINDEQIALLDASHTLEYDQISSGLYIII